MSADLVQHPDAAAGGSGLTALPMRKRKSFDDEKAEPELKKVKTDMPPQSAPATIAGPTATADQESTKESEASDGLQPLKRAPMTKAREVRLEQNRKAARESRRRKKVMIEELQRSVIFFSRANGTLKQQNDELTRLLVQAQGHITAAEGGKQSGQTQQDTKQATESTAQQQAQANAVAQQAMYESQGFPAAAARQAAQTMNAGSQQQSNNQTSAPAAQATTNAQEASGSNPLPAMQPGATMQAMANFQQAAAAAMQSAMGQMQSIPGVNMSQLAATPVGANAQQAYTDTMTALAMQQAAAAAAGQQFGIMQPGAVPFMQTMMGAWQQQQQAQQNQQQPQDQQQQQNQQ